MFFQKNRSKRPARTPGTPAEQRDALLPVWEANHAWASGRPLPREEPTAADAPRLAVLRVALFEGSSADSSGFAHFDTDLPGGWPARNDPVSTAAEPQRVAAAYSLARLGTAAALEVLGDGLGSNSEAVRRAAAFGLVAAPTELAEPTLTEALRSSASSVSTRKFAAMALGENSAVGTAAAAALGATLRSDDSVFVRATAASALGSIGRRASARRQQASDAAAVVDSCVEALVDCLEREGNRPCHPVLTETSASDLWEGGFPLGTHDRPYLPEGRFKPVRSAVRESALSALVVLCSQRGVPSTRQGTARLAAALAAVIGQDRNAVAAGFAMDALQRLAESNGGMVKAEALLDVVAACDVQCPEVLDRTAMH